MRYFFETSYLGTRYHGWQIQKNAESIQEVISGCLCTLTKSDIEIIGSGRTDTGVHAVSQWFHADMPTVASTNSFQNRINSFLPPDIAITNIRPVLPGAHARFDAKRRDYKYIITRRKDPLLYKRAYCYGKTLDIDAMHRAAKELLGEHDFKCFSRVKTDVNHFRCTVKKAIWLSDGQTLVFHISADRFLRGMVRAIVGTMLLVGSEKLNLAGFRNILASGDRRMAGPSVPAEGLYLERIEYPKSVFLN